MNYLSLFSGIEAATLAWEPLGWEPMAFAEIEPFPSAVLAERWPDVPNLGDILEVDWEHWMADYGRPDVVIAGSPCQAFSVAGNRLSLEDARGNLTLFTAELVRLLNPRVFLWENVPGALSTKDNAFGCFIGEIVGAGQPLQPTGKRWTNAGLVCGPEARLAWRVLDAQYFGVPQRRRRLFAARCPRDGADPAEVLSQRESLFGDPAPRRQERSRPAGSPQSGSRGGNLLADTGLVRGLKARFGTSGSDLDDAEAGHLIPAVMDGGLDERVCPTIDSRENGGGGNWGSDFMAGGGLVEEPGPWWDGSDTSETIDVSRVLKQQTMPDKARFAAVLEQTPWVRCDSCDDFLCTIHGVHVHDCPCPTIDTWAEYELHPYSPCDIGRVMEMLKQEADPPAIKVGSGLGIPSSPAVAIPIQEPGCGTGKAGFDDTRKGLGVGGEDDPMYSLQAGHQHAVAFKPSHYTRDKDGAPSEICPPLTKEGDLYKCGECGHAEQHLTHPDECPACGGHDYINLMIRPTIGPDAGSEFDFSSQVYRKSQRAHSADDCETWVDDGVANTLNAYEDHCDARATHAVVFTQNQRDEVRDLDDCAGALAAESGSHQTNYVTHVFTSDGETADPIGANEARTYTKEGGHNFRMHNVVADDPVQVQWASGGGQLENPTAKALRANAEYSYQFTRHGMAVRRLTPIECERLQGMPDNHTRVPWRGKGAEDCPDGPRYKAIGNSMAVPVIRWLGQQIDSALREKDD